MIDTALQALMDFLQQASPMVWSTLVRQVYVIAFSSLFWAVIFLMGGFGFWRLSLFVVTREEFDHDWREAQWFLRVLSFVAIIISFVTIGEAIMHLANPDYYAIMLILQSLK